ncbi:MAG: glycine oxidase ThiO [Oceanicaulis sp. HLUCCA04]|nr:MAG: glycine oxidase ThiO [Oceanicaulis sp. HLUCCA04]
MIAPGAEIGEARSRPHDRSRAFAALAQHSAAMWPDWAARLLAETGIDPAYRPCGSLVPLREAGMVDSFAALGVEGEWLHGAALQARLPGACLPDGALFLPGDAQVSSLQLTHALMTSLDRKGVEIRENTRVTSLVRSGGGWRVFTESGETIDTDYVVLAAGWAATQLHPSAAEIYPVKGQAVMLDAGEESASWPLLRAGNVYLAAKPGGRLIVGASVEPGRSNGAVDPAVAQGMLQRAARYLPGVAQMNLLAHWAGVRPALPGLMPRAGLAEPGLVVALGAYRHGVMLAPALAEGLAALIDEGRLPDILAPFAPDTVNEGLSSAR